MTSEAVGGGRYGGIYPMEDIIQGREYRTLLAAKPSGEWRTIGATALEIHCRRSVKRLNFFKRLLKTHLFAMGLQRCLVFHFVVSFVTDF